MGQRRELRSPEGTRKMLADKRRLVKHLRTELGELKTALQLETVRGVMIAHRFKVLMRMGKILLVKDTGEVKE